jgi:hypothetical protein
MIALIAEYWPWIVAYPFVGAFLFGFDPSARGLLAMAVYFLLWPFMLVTLLGFLVRGIFR